MSGLVLPAWQNQLWTPGQIKPQGVPKIDWTHPLARGLITYWFDTGLGFYVDLVTGDTTTLGASSTYSGTGPSAYGTGFIFPSSTPTTIQARSVFGQQSWAAPYSFAMGIVQRTALPAGNPGYFGLCTVSQNDAFIFYWHNAANTLAANFANATDVNMLTGGPVIGTFYVAVGVATGASSQVAYLNGTQVGTSSGTSAYSDTGMKMTFNADGPDDVGASRCGATVFFGAAWNRALSSDESKFLYTDPYSLLIPVEPEMMALGETFAPQLLRIM